MEFDYYSPSETFVVLTADQFVGRDDGLLEQQKQDSHVYKSGFYSYNFHIFRLFGFGKEEVDVFRFMSKQFIALFVYLSFALSSLFLPQKCVVLF